MRSRKWAGFRSIVCPVDFSESSRRALRYAASVAARSDASLTVAYANDPWLVTAAATELNDRGFVKRSARELRRFIDASLSVRSRRQLRLKSHVSIGSAGDEILRAASTMRSDLIVMGTQGLTGADRWLLGSTTLNVLQRTAVPVLAVPTFGVLRSQSLTSWPRGRLVAALDLGPRANEVVETSARIAQWFESSLLLIHVVSAIAAPAWLRGALTGRDRLHLARARQDLEDLAAIARRRVETDVRLVCGRPADEIAALVAEERAGLVVTTLRDRAGWFGARRGSVSYHVLSHAVVPVLACPQQWRPR
jgi:universal stress protein A